MDVGGPSSRAPSRRQVAPWRTRNHHSAGGAGGAGRVMREGNGVKGRFLVQRWMGVGEDAGTGAALPGDVEVVEALFERGELFRGRTGKGRNRLRIGREIVKGA